MVGQFLVDTEPEIPLAVADPAERYLREYDNMQCKPNIVMHYCLMVRENIAQGLGELPVSEARQKKHHQDPVRFERNAHGNHPGSRHFGEDVQNSGILGDTPAGAGTRAGRCTSTR